MFEITLSQKKTTQVHDEIYRKTVPHHGRLIWGKVCLWEVIFLLMFKAAQC